jgi:MFS family permease
MHSAMVETGIAKGSWSDIFRNGLGLYSALIIGGIAMNATQMLVIAIIMPTIVRDIGGASFYTWAAMLYTIGAIVGGASTGTVWGHLGARRTYTLAAGVFALGTAGCAMAPNIGALIVARGVQGWAGGLVSGSGMALIASVFEQRLRTRIIAISQGMFTACHLSGPIVGGVFAAMDWWRGSFWIMAPLMLIFAGLAYWKDPGPDQPRGGTHALFGSAVSPVWNIGRRRALRRGQRIGAGVGIPRPSDFGGDGAYRADLLDRPASRRQSLPAARVVG